jgi:hypothetical protein
MKLSLLCLGLAALPVSAASVFIDNTAAAAVASGDRANLRAFAFRPQAGGSGPAAPLEQTVLLTSLTLHRPGFNDATTPQFGSAAGQVTSSATPVYLKVYSSFTGGTGVADVGTLLGISGNGISWDEVDAINGAGPSSVTAAPFEGYTYNFPSVALDRDTTYWMVFSETGDDSVDVAQFRMIVEPGAGAAGSGYLPETIQARTTTGASQDWGVYFTANVESIPEPSTAGSLGLAVLAVALRRRR